MHIISCYFPGSTDTITLKQFKRDISILPSITNDILYLVGDFNAKHRLWHNVRSNQVGKILYEEMLLSYTHQHQHTTHLSPET